MLCSGPLLLTSVTAEGGSLHLTSSQSSLLSASLSCDSTLACCLCSYAVGSEGVLHNKKEEEGLDC